MRKSTLVGGLAVALASMVLVLPPPTVSAQTDGSGDAYSDLYIVLRDPDGVPIKVTFPTAEGTVECVQPISYSLIPTIGDVTPVATENPVDGRDVYLVPLVGELAPTAPLIAAAEEEVEAEPCDPQSDFSAYVSEVELERLNLVRTTDTVLWKKLIEVGARLNDAVAITLDGAGRITTDGVTIDASPDHAAIYAANFMEPYPDPTAKDGGKLNGGPGGLMDTGTIRYWDAEAGADTNGDGTPDGAFVYPLGQTAQVSEFDEWMLAAAAIGTAAGKSVPITIDTIAYYNRVAAPNSDISDWGHVSPLPQTGIADEQFIDYTEFSYERADVYQGCTIWLDVPTLTWKVGTVLDRIELDEYPDIVDLDAQTIPGTVKNVAGFAQLADDVRAVINYLHLNEVVVNPDTGFGFYIDPVFQNTCNDSNPDLDPFGDGVGLSQAAMAKYLNELVIQPGAPSVTITGAPAATTTATEATFAFDAASDASRVLCALDGGAIEDCVSPKTYTGLTPGEHTFTVMAMSVEGKFASDTHTWTILPPGEDTMITPLTPVRFADTRPGFVAADGLFFGTGPVAAGGVVQVPIAGRGAVPVGAKAVVANVTVVGSVAPGFVTVFPCGTLPVTASVNYAAGEAVGNEVIAKLSPVGSICVYAHSAVNVVVDVAGYVPASSEYEALTPARLIDTRPTPVAAGGFIEIPVVDRVGVPVGAKAVVANVTVVGSVAPGFVTVFPCGTLPVTASVNYAAGEAVGNEVIAKLSPVGSICVYAHSAVNVVVDVAGYVPASSEYEALTPARLIDTRPTPVAAGGFIEIPVVDRVGVPVGAKAVVANVTVVGSVAPGFVTVFPCGTLPVTASVNYAAGEAVGNEVIAKLSPVGSICVYAHSAVNVVVDVAGYL